MKVDEYPFSFPSERRKVPVPCSECSMFAQEPAIVCKY
jgi:hypothetical protein